jgi:uncharacterized protein YoxC
MHSQNQVQLTISHTDRVRHITEVQVQGLLQDRTVLLHQVQEITEAVRRCVATVAAVVAEVTVVEEVVAEVAVVPIQAVQAEVLPVAVDVLQEVVLRLPVAVDYRN